MNSSSSVGSVRPSHPRAAAAVAILSLFAAVAGLPLSTALAQDDCDQWVNIGDPTPRSLHSLVLDEGRGVLVMFGGVPQVTQTAATMVGQRTASSETWELSGSTWFNATTLGPSPRAKASLAFDGSSGKAVLFGGQNIDTTNTFFNDVWEWDGTRWSQRQTNAGPSPRIGAAFAYDPVRNTLWLHGGRSSTGATLIDLWRLDANIWTQVQPPQPLPGQATGHAFIFEPASGDMLLIGGESTGSTWRWDGAAWSLVNSSSPLSFDVTATYDPSRQAIVAARQVTTGLTPLYQWNGTAWVQAGNLPQNLTLVRLGFNPVSGALTVIGGRSQPVFPDYIWPATYELSAVSGWQVVEGKPLPRGLSNPALTFDSDRSVTVSFGGGWGADGSALTSETWELRNDQWRLRSTSGPFARSGAALAYSPSLGQTVLYGGSYRGGAGPILWGWDGQAWSVLNAAPVGGNTNTTWRGMLDPATGDLYFTARGQPVVRFDGTTLTSIAPSPSIDGTNAAFEFDPVRNAIIGAGGQYVSSTFRIQGIATSFIVNSQQTGRWGPRMAYDEGRGGLVLFGGFNSPSPEGSAWPSRTYMLGSDETSWSVLNNRGPTGRKFHDMVYDSAGARILMIGGSQHAVAMAETWKLSRGAAEIVVPPANAAASPGDDAEFFVIARGGGGIRYQWRCNGQRLQDGNGVSGSRTDTLRIASVSAADAGVYTCTVSNACGEDESAGALLGVCIADFNGDDGIDDLDIGAFFTAFESGDTSADINGDDGIDDLDITAFFAAFEAGC